MFPGDDGMPVVARASLCFQEQTTEDLQCFEYQGYPPPPWACTARRSALALRIPIILSGSPL